jgi:hypothetical protein
MCTNKDFWRDLRDVPNPREILEIHRRAGSGDLFGMFWSNMARNLLTIRGFSRFAIDTFCRESL